MVRGREMALSVLAVASAAVAGYVLRSDRRVSSKAQANASVGARIVEEVPPTATVVDVSSDRLGEIPGARRVIDQAVSTGSSDRWAHVTFDDDRAWEVVDSLRRSLPYHEADGPRYNGVYVRSDGHVVVLDAIGWARTEGLSPER